MITNMFTIIAVKRRYEDNPLDEFSLPAKKMKCEEPSTGNIFYRFYSNKDVEMSTVKKMVEKSHLKYKTKFMELCIDELQNRNYVDVETHVTEEENIDYTYDYYCTEYAEGIKDYLIEMICCKQVDDGDYYSSDEENPNNKDYWGNEYDEEDEIWIRCPDYEDEDERDEFFNDSDCSYHGDSD
jgi:hypothetical protein